MTNPLASIIPATYRKYVYAAIALASLVLGVWQATDHDWAAFVAGLIVALSHSVAASNTSDAYQPEPTGPQDDAPTTKAATK